LPEHQILIEYDGRHHFEIIDCWGGEISFIERKNNDCIKTDFASNFNIKLIRIPYFESNDIENGWDGTYKNKFVYPGSYNYKIRIKLAQGQIIERTGNIAVIFD